MFAHFIKQYEYKKHTVCSTTAYKHGLKQVVEQELPLELHEVGRTWMKVGRRGF
jgi:hypothetical protein